VDYLPQLPDDASRYVTADFELIHTETVPALRLEGIVVQIQPRRVDDGHIGEFEGWLETVANGFPPYSTPWLVRSEDSKFEATVTIHDKLAGVIHYDNNSDTSCGCACLLLSHIKYVKDKRPAYGFNLLVLEKVEDTMPESTFRRVGIAETVWVPDAKIGFAIHQQSWSKILIV